MVRGRGTRQTHKMMTSTWYEAEGLSEAWRSAIDNRQWEDILEQEEAAAIKRFEKENIIRGDHEFIGDDMFTYNDAGEPI